MNTLRYSLEYHCYPIWNYDENGELVDNDLPDELRMDEELDSLLLKVQAVFDGLFTDTPRTFSSHGFRSEKDRRDFLSMLLLSVKLLRQRYGMAYRIECDYDDRSFLPEAETQPDTR